jgi:hypothetical protein
MTYYCRQWLTKDRPVLSSERAPHNKQDCSCQTVIIWSWAPSGGSTPRLTDRWSQCDFDTDFDLSLCATKTYGEVDVQTHVFLTSALVGGEWSVPRASHITPWEWGLGTHWMGVWVGPRDGFDDVERRKILLLPGLELRRFGCPACSQSLHWLRYPGSPTFVTYEIDIYE